jgi:hypothetical protein
VPESFHDPEAHADARREAGDEEKAAEELFNDDVRAVMSTPFGKRFAYWLIFGHLELELPVFDMSVKYSTEIAAALNDGKRHAAIALRDLLIDLTPDQYLAMMSEQIRARQADVARLVKKKKSAGGNER